MAFFQVDDQLALSSKAQGLVRRAMSGDVTGLAAMGLWTMAGSVVQGKHTDGHVDLQDLFSLVLNLDVAQQLAAELVAAGLWHAHGHDCHRCPPVEPGHWYFHDWAAMRYERGSDAKLRQAKQAERNSARLRDQVWARDRVAEPGPSESEEALCAYCLTLVKRDDHKSDRRPEVDHIDPDSLGLDNLVISCRDCNRKKGQRRPGDAGLTLHVTERHRSDLARRGYRFDLVTGRRAPMWKVLPREVNGSDAPEASSDPNPATHTAPTAPQGAQDGPQRPDAHQASQSVQEAPARGRGTAPAANGSEDPSSSEPNCGGEVNGSEATASSDPTPALEVNGSDAPEASSDPNPDPDEIESPVRFRDAEQDPTAPELSRPHARPRAGARGRRQGRAGQGQGRGEAGPGQGTGKAGNPPPDPPRRRRRNRRANRGRTRR